MSIFIECKNLKDKNKEVFHEKTIIASILCFSLLISISACGVSSSSSPVGDSTKSSSGNKEKETSATATEKTEFNIGETWTVDGQWSVTVLGATETEDRNQFSDKTPDAVYLVDYVYSNIGYDHDSLDGLFISMEDNIVDSAGFMGYSYPGDKTYYAQETPIGASCTAQACIGVDNAGVFKITISKPDDKGKKQSATFIIDPNAEYADLDISGGLNVDVPALAIGETWTVDGQWSLTITGVIETDDRNEFSDKNPEAVYIVDYTYTNLGYENEDLDGLFISLDDMIVDNAGAMGYSYPGDQTYYAQETPVGATCNAQEVIGVDHAGDFRITITKYDGNKVKQSETFLVSVD